MRKPRYVRRPLKTSVWFLALTLASLLPFYYPLTHPTRFLGMRDIIRIALPFRYFELVSWEQFGRIPRWNPYLYGGVPFRADLVSAALDPMNLLFVLFGSKNFFFAECWYFALRMPIGFLGLYVFFRALRLRRAHAAALAFCFAVSAFFVSATCITSVSLVPLYFGSLLLAVRKGRARYGALAAASLAAMVYQGGPDFALFCGLASPFACRAPSPRARASWRSRARPWAALAAVAALSLLLAAPAVLPYLRLHQHSARALLDEGAALTDPFHPLRLLEIFLPEIWGNIFPGYTYIGSDYFHLGFDFPLIFSFYVSFLVPTLVLLAFSSPALRRRNRWLLLGACALFVISFGGVGPVYRFLFEHWDLWRKFRYPEKWAALALVLLLGVAARGWQRLQAILRRGARFPAVSVLLPLAAAGLAVAAPRQPDSIEHSLGRYLALQAAFAGLVWLLLRRKRGAGLCLATLVVLAAGEGISNSINYVWDEPVSTLSSPIADRLRDDMAARRGEIAAGGAYRAFATGDSWRYPEGNYIPPNLDYIGRSLWLATKNLSLNSNMLYGISLPTVYPELGGSDRHVLYADFERKQLMRRYFDLLSVYYFVRPLPELGFDRNPGALPFAMPVLAAERVPDFAAARARLTDPAWDYHRSTLIEADELPVPGGAPFPLEVARSLDSIRIRARGEARPALLLVNESFDTNWVCRPHCRVVGRANGWALGLYVESWGPEGIELRYE